MAVIDNVQKFRLYLCIYYNIYIYCIVVALMYFYAYFNDKKIHIGAYVQRELNFSFYEILRVRVQHTSKGINLSVIIFYPLTSFKSSLPATITLPCDSPPSTVYILRTSISKPTADGAFVLARYNTSKKNTTRTKSPRKLIQCKNIPR